MMNWCVFCNLILKMTLTLKKTLYPEDDYLPNRLSKVSHCQQQYVHPNDQVQPTYEIHVCRLASIVILNLYCLWPHGLLFFLFCFTNFTYKVIQKILDQDSRHWIPDHLDSGCQSLAIVKIPSAEFKIPKSRIPDFESIKVPIPESRLAKFPPSDHSRTTVISCSRQEQTDVNWGSL